MRILGLSCHYHDSAAALVDDDGIIMALQEERVSRRKQDPAFPLAAIATALDAAGCDVSGVDEIVFYETPRLKLKRLLRQGIDGWPRSRRLLFEGIPRFITHKLPIEAQIRRELGYTGRISLCGHHRAHAAAAFYTSGFERALVLTVDGVGEQETTAVHIGEAGQLRPVRAIHFPDSLGLLYSVFTQYLGFEVNEGEYKVMGLAPYGTPRYLERILGSILLLKDDGSFALGRRFFDFNGEIRHYTDDFAAHLGVPPRPPGQPVTEAHQDLAASIQRALETALVHILRPLIAEFGLRDVCLGGGVALNCTANAHLIRELGVRLHIHPAAGDAGGALGAALDGLACNGRSPRLPFQPYLGAAHGDAAIARTLGFSGLPHRRVDDIERQVAERLAAGQVVAVFQGRDEWGPRALGNRSILADPRTAEMKDHLNARIKFREEFRPFAPAILAEHYGTYFETLGMDASPHMLFTHRVLRPDDIPAVTHADGTARVQTVARADNPRFYDTIAAFHALTGVPVVINTSFNLRGEPIVGSPADALRTFRASGIDCLAIGDYLVERPASGTP